MSAAPPITDETITPPATATLLSKNGLLTREQLRDLPTPPATNTHKPIPHYDLIQALIDTLAYRKIAPVWEQYAVSPDTMKFYATIDLDMGFPDARYALGIRNSHDKTIALGITAGYRVLVCDNLAFHGDYTPVLKKHTKNFNLDEALVIGMDHIQRNFEPMQRDVSRWRETQISDATAKLLIYDAFVEGGMDLPKYLMRQTHEYYFNPPHEEFRPRTLYSLNNAFTGAAKSLDPIPRQRAAASIGEYFKHKKL